MGLPTVGAGNVVGDLRGRIQPEDTIRFIMYIRMLMRREREALNEVRGRATARDRGGKWTRNERRKGDEEWRGGKKEEGNRLSTTLHGRHIRSNQQTINRCRIPRGDGLTILAIRSGNEQRSKEPSPFPRRRPLSKERDVPDGNGVMAEPAR